LRKEKIGLKIREHTLQKVPYLLIVGEREIENQQVAVRLLKGKDKGAMILDAFVEILNAKMADYI
jgi:threonyl-tRNA synthetase